MSTSRLVQYSNLGVGTSPTLDAELSPCCGLWLAGRPPHKPNVTHSLQGVCASQVKGKKKIHLCCTDRS